MTNAQRIITNYLKSRNITSYHLLTEDTVAAGERVYTVNIYGDIMDGATKKIIADAKIEHNLCSIGIKIPTEWKDR